MARPHASLSSNGFRCSVCKKWTYLGYGKNAFKDPKPPDAVCPDCAEGFEFKNRIRLDQ